MTEPKTERHLHELYAAYLRRENLMFIHARMDKESTIANGWPDFTVLHRGRVLCIEMKYGKGTLSPEQIKTLNALNMDGTSAHVCRNVAEAIIITDKWTKGENHAGEPQYQPTHSDLRIFRLGNKKLTVRPTGPNQYDIQREATPEDLATLKPF